MVAAQHEGDEAAGLALDEQRLDAAPGGDAEQPGQIRDGMDPRGIDGAQGFIRLGTRLARRRARDHLDVGREPAGGERDGVFAVVGDDVELLRPAAADCARVGVDHAVIEPEPLEGPAVGVVHRQVRPFEALGVEIERIGVLHDELARAHHPEARADLVTELRLDLVKVDRQLLVAAHLAPGDVRDDLLVGRADAEVAFVPVLQAQQLRTEVAPAPGLLPELGRLDGGHQHFLGAGRVHLLANNGFDLAEHAHAEREPGVETRREQADQAGPEHEPVAHDLGLRRRFAHRGEKRLRASHWSRSSGRLPDELHADGRAGDPRRIIGKCGSSLRMRRS